MFYRVVFCVCCFAFTGPNFTYGMEQQKEVEYDPLDGSVLVGQEKPQIMHFPVNNIQSLGVLLGQFIDTVKDTSPAGKEYSLLIMQALFKGIESLYKQNQTELVRFIDANRQKLTLEQQNMVDDCLRKCENNKCFFIKRCKNALFYFIYYSLVALLIIMSLEKQMGSAMDPEQIMAKLDNFISIALPQFYL